LTDATRELASGKVVVDEPGDVGVVRIRIANPDKRGALDHEILDTITEVVKSQDARCLVITGDGPVFSAGYDIGNFTDESAFADAAEKLVAHPFTDAIEALEAYRYPVIAALNGHAIGGGLELAVTCDLRVAARGVKMGMPPAKIGLIYGHTGLRRFMEVCGLANTNELFFTGRNVDADRAYDMGLVNQVVDPDELEETVLSLAAEIAANSPLSLAGNKRILRTLRAIPGALPEAIERELVELRESCFYTEDFREGIKAFGEKRQPRWQGR
jgi:enoyl-CoA hydratase/carnithine racemase